MGRGTVPEERRRWIGALLGARSLSILLTTVVSAIGAVLVGFYVLGAANALSTPYSLDYVEGFIVRIAAEPGLLYQPVGESPHLFTSYPPLYYLVVGALARVADPLVAARAVTITATAALTGLVWATVRRFGPGRQARLAATVAAVLFLGSPLVGFWGVLARVDVLGLLFGVGALYWFHTREDRRQLVGAGALCLLALYTKQSLFAAPVAITVALLIKRDVKRAVGFAVGVAVVGFLGLVGLHLATSGHSTLHLIAFNQQPLVPIRFLFFLVDFLVVHAGIVAVAVVALVRTDDIPVVYSAYGVTGAGVALMGLKAGSHTNFFLDLHVACVLLSGGILASWMQSPGAHSLPWKRLDRSWVRTGVLLLLVVQLGIYGGANATIGMPVSPEPGAGDATAILSDVDGPVLSEDALLLRASGRNATYQPNLMRSVIRMGYLPRDPLVDRIERREYAAIVLKSKVDSDVWPFRWTAAQCRAIDDSYDLLAQVGTYWIYVPGGPDATSSVAGAAHGTGQGASRIDGRLGGKSSSGSTADENAALVDVLSGGRSGC